jgi:hypothetical protein
MLAAFALLAVANVLQWVQTVQSFGWLQALGYTPSPIYTVFAGFFFMLLFIASPFTLWLRKSYAPLLGGMSLVLYLVWSWINRLVLSPNPTPVSNHILSMGVSLGLVLLAEFSLFVLQPFMEQKGETPELEERND